MKRSFLVLLCGLVLACGAAMAQPDYSEHQIELDEVRDWMLVVRVLWTRERQ